MPHSTRGPSILGFVSIQQTLWSAHGSQTEDMGGRRLPQGNEMQELIVQGVKDDQPGEGTQGQPQGVVREGQHPPPHLPPSCPPVLPLPSFFPLFNTYIHIPALKMWEEEN